jgi:twitching motility protein PilT
MRVIPTSLPDLKSLGAPDEIADVLTVRGGLVLVTGPRGCGKSSTLAGMIDHINESEACHILTIEDPIEFLHNHKASTVHQRELHSDTPGISHALRAALRQAPNVIAVGELKDNESIALALDAAESGHLVLSTLNSPNAAKAIDRLVAAFAASEESVTRERLARTLRCVICQRLIPRKQDGERLAVFQLVTDDALQGLLGSAKDANDGGQNAISAIDREIERMVRAGLIDPDTGLAHAADPGTLSKNLSSN